MIKLLELLKEIEEGIEEGIEDIQFISPDDITGNHERQLNHLEKESGINILSDRELTVLALKNENVVGALYESSSGNVYTFDVIVDKNEQKRGIGSKLIDIGLSDYTDFRDIGYPLKLEVVNKNLIPHLLKRGLRIRQKDSGSDVVIMTY